MTRQELEARFSELKHSLETGGITRQTFNAEISKLKYKAKDGIWYQIDSSTGGWLRWTGKAWEKVVTKTSSPQPPPSPPGTGTAKVYNESGNINIKRGFGPTLRHFLKLTWKNFARRLPIAILLSLVMIPLYFFMTVMRNDGFASSPGSITIFEQALGVGSGILGSGFSGGIFVMIFITLIISFLKSFFTKGPGPTIAAIFKTPGTIANYFSEAGSMATAGFISGVGLAFVLAFILNGFASIALAVGAVALIMSGARQGLSMLVRAMWESTYGLSQGQGAGKFTAETGYVTMFGSSIGFIIGAVIHPYLALGIGLVCLAIALALVKGSSGRSMATTVLVIGAGYFSWHIFGDTFIAIAHDGGFYEPGAEGDFSKWIKSEGAFAATLASLLGGAGTGIGAFLGPSLLNAFQNMTPPPDTAVRGDILDGDKALQWLRDNNLLDDNNVLTDEFWNDWYNQVGGDSTLGGIAGNWDPDNRGNPISGIAIVIYPDGIPPTIDDPSGLLGQEPQLDSDSTDAAQADTSTDIPGTSDEELKAYVERVKRRRLERLAQLAIGPPEITRVGFHPILSPVLDKINQTFDKIRIQTEPKKPPQKPDQPQESESKQPKPPQVDRRPWGLSEITMAFIKIDSTKPQNSQRVDWLAEQSKIIRQCTQGADILRAVGGTAQADGSKTIAEAALKGGTGVAQSVGILDGPGATQMLTNPGPLNRAWDKLAETKGFVRNAREPLPMNRAQVDAAIKECQQAGGREAEIKALKDITKVFDSLGGKK